MIFHSYEPNRFMIKKFLLSFRIRQNFVYQVKPHGYRPYNTSVLCVHRYKNLTKCVIYEYYKYIGTKEITIYLYCAYIGIKGKFCNISILHVHRYKFFVIYLYYTYFYTQHYEYFFVRTSVLVFPVISTKSSLFLHKKNKLLQKFIRIIDFFEIFSIKPSISSS